MKDRREASNDRGRGSDLWEVRVRKLRREIGQLELEADEAEAHALSLRDEALARRAELETLEEAG